MTEPSSIQYQRVLPPLGGVISYRDDQVTVNEDGDGGITELQAQVPKGDRRDGRVYFYTEEIELHINVAVATGRPLVVMGASGCGKSSLAHSVARAMGCPYYEYVATSESDTKDLYYYFDSVRRIADAEIKGSEAQTLWGHVHQYIDPGPLWWAMDPASATRRGRELDTTMPFRAAPNPAVWKPRAGGKPATDIPAVLLIDEIDKTKPDFTGNLLVPLGSYKFTIDELGHSVELDRPASPPLIIITSNQQRLLPEPMLRRCIILKIGYHSPEQLVEIGMADAEMYPLRSATGAVCVPKNTAWFKFLAEKMCNLRDGEVSTAEYLDAIHAMRVLCADTVHMENSILETIWRTDRD
jgi:MoxR-like ATPase